MPTWAFGGRWVVRGGVAVLAVAALGLTACGDDDGDGASSADLTATADEWEFDPDEWTVGAGQFSIEFTNDGSIEHEWAVMTLDGRIESEDDFESEDQVLGEVEAIPPGETTTETLTIDEPGTYQVTCLVPGHFNAGMEGTLIVE